MKRLINSENILIDCTFSYPKDFYETLIIMFYDNLYNKMIPGVFVTVNNKKQEGYKAIFNSLKSDILCVTNNDITQIKLKTVTTDFETALYKSFFECFNIIPNLKHNGCFFHYLKNIRKYLIKNGYTKKANEKHYDYIIKSVYKLPFISNIDKNIKNEIKNICDVDPFYKDFENYFNKQ